VRGGAPRASWAALAGLVIVAAAFTAERERGGAGPDKSDAYPYHIFVPLAGSDGLMPIEHLRLRETIALLEAEAKWQAAGVQDYRIVAFLGAFGLSERAYLVVRGGVVVSATTECPLPLEFVLCPTVDPAAFTVPALFERIRAQAGVLPTVREFGKPYLEASYDEELGFPLRIHFSFAFGAPDSGQGITVESLEILPAK
jgi:hypothetical protein